MKKAALCLLDVVLIFAILAFFYIRAFYGHSGYTISSEMAHWRNLCFVLALLAIFILPFRVKSYPALGNYIMSNRKGEKRSALIFPLLSMLSVIFGSILIIRIVVLLAGKAG